GIALERARGQSVHAVGTLCLDRWNGTERVQLRLIDMAPADASRCQPGQGAQAAKVASPFALSSPRLRRGMKPPAERSTTMSKLKLSVAVGNYDRVRPRMDGAAPTAGVRPRVMHLPPCERSSRPVHTT